MFHEQDRWLSFPKKSSGSSVVSSKSTTCQFNENLIIRQVLSRQQLETEAKYLPEATPEAVELLTSRKG